VVHGIIFPVDLDGMKAGSLDATLEGYADDLRGAGEAKSAVTLSYTHSIHRVWRQVVRMLPVPDGSAVLDVGSGFGILPFELAANVAVRVGASIWNPRSSSTP
jgi:hypothetical protein